VSRHGHKLIPPAGPNRKEGEKFERSSARCGAVLSRSATGPASLTWRSEPLSRLLATPNAHGPLRDREAPADRLEKATKRRGRTGRACCGRRLWSSAARRQDRPGQDARQPLPPPPPPPLGRRLARGPVRGAGVRPFDLDPSRSGPGGKPAGTRVPFAVGRPAPQDPPGRRAAPHRAPTHTGSNTWPRDGPRRGPARAGAYRSLISHGRRPGRGSPC